MRSVTESGRYGAAVAPSTPGSGSMGAARPVDGRAERTVEAVLGVALLGSFVFRIPVIVPVLGLVTAAGALGGPRCNVLHIAYDRLVRPRLGPADGDVDARAVRTQDGLAALLLLTATLAILAGIAPVGWLLVVAEAIIAIIAATTLVLVGERLRPR